MEKQDESVRSGRASSPADLLIRTIAYYRSRHTVQSLSTVRDRLNPVFLVTMRGNARASKAHREFS